MNRICDVDSTVEAIALMGGEDGDISVKGREGVMRVNLFFIILVPSRRKLDHFQIDLL